MIINKKMVASMEVLTLQQLIIDCLIHPFKGKGMFTNEEAQLFVNLLQKFKHYHISLGVSDRLALQAILFKRCTQSKFEEIVDADLFVLGAIDQLVIEKLGWGVAFECLDKGLIECIDLKGYNFKKRKLEDSEVSIDWDRLDLSGVKHLDLSGATDVPMRLIATALEAGVKTIYLRKLDLNGLEGLIDWDRLDLIGVICLDLVEAKHVPMRLIAKVLEAGIKTIDLSHFDLAGLEELIDWDRLDLTGVKHLDLKFAKHVPMRLIATVIEAGVKTINLDFVDLTGLEGLINWYRLDLSGVERLDLEDAKCVPMGLIAKVIEAGVKMIDLSHVDLAGLEELIYWDRLHLSGVKHLDLMYAKHVPMKLIAKALEAGVKTIGLEFVDLTGLEGLINWDRLDLSGVEQLDLEDAKYVPMGLIAKALEAGVKTIDLRCLDLTGLEGLINWDRLDLSDVE